MTYEDGRARGVDLALVAIFELLETMKLFVAATLLALCSAFAPTLVGRASMEMAASMDRRETLNAAFGILTGAAIVQTPENAFAAENPALQTFKGRKKTPGSVSWLL